MQKSTVDKQTLPDSPGVYFFLGPRSVAKGSGGVRPKRGKGGEGRSGKILYIGKAPSLRSRVRSYFNGMIRETRGPLIEQMIGRAGTLDFQKTDSVLEALLLESRLIKKYQPPYNALQKDDKSFNYVVITKEEYPRILVVRARDLTHNSQLTTYNSQTTYGPFPHSGLFKEAMKLIRRLFPFRDEKCTPNSGKPCFNRQLGLCPGVCTGEISKKDYGRQIRHLKLFFEGKKSALVRGLTKEMKTYATLRQFEKAAAVKHTLFALKHIQDVSLLKDDVSPLHEYSYRIEAYDIAHTSGTEMIGVMTVIEGGTAKKSHYRKFKIRSVSGANDTAALAEVLNRRLGHPEWPLPDLIVVDGGKAQRNAAEGVLTASQHAIPVVSVVKDERHRPRGIEGNRALWRTRESEILLANSESHRFALSYHRKRIRVRNF